MDNKEKEFANKGVHFHSGTGYSPDDLYFGFIVTSDDVVINDIDYKIGGLNTGDITTIGMIPGMFYPIAGGFTKIKLDSGNMLLLKSS